MNRMHEKMGEVVTNGNDQVRHVEVPNRLRAIKKRTPEPIKSAARSGLRRFGVATASQRVLPNFLIIGTKRGGTTSLMNWLSSHPEVLPLFPVAQQIKSPHYFDINFWRGEDWYRSFYPTRRRLDRITERLGHAPALGEASPYYMFHPAVPARVAQTAPEVKLIVLLRDPVKRAYSNYWERRGSGQEDLETFEAAMDAEESRLAGVTEEKLRDPRFYSADHDNHTYLARGRYLEQLERWFAHFDREQMLILPSEQLYADPPGTSFQVQRFLGITDSDIVKLDHYNKLPVPPIAEETKARLVEYYTPYNQALYDALGVDLGWSRTEGAR